MEIAAAGAQIGAGQAHKGQTRTVGAAADGPGHRLHTGAAHGLHGIVHQMAVWLDLLDHIAVGIPDVQSNRVRAVFGVEEVGSGPGEALLLLQLFAVVVPEDIAQESLLHRSAHLVQMQKALIALGIFRLFGGGQHHFKLHGDAHGVFHLVFGGAGMDVQALHRHPHGGGVEVFIFQLAIGAAIHGEGIVRAEAGHIKQVCAPADLLVGGEGHLHRAVAEGGIGHQLLGQRQDLGDARLVVGAQQGGAVGDHQVLSLLLPQLGVIGGGEDDVLFLVQKDIAAIVVFHDAGADVCGGNIVHHIHMGDKAQNLALITGNVAGDGAVNIAVFIHAGVLQAQRLHFLHQSRTQQRLLFRAGAGGRIGVGGGVEGYIAKQSFVSAHKKRSPFFLETVSCSDIAHSRKGAGPRRSGSRPHC